ncbi:putative mucin [Rosellinia necatrix]|uniref:Putative mucin n=1 Tax=Rosellinia necatrix TaxID=77044 RepID=A0A1W2TQ08_ROSNE|nr:putative mucin [Rosellinia necatrix]
MESLPATGKQSSVLREPSHDVLLDSLSWLDEDDDLDLRLTLDDYRTEFKPSRPVTTTGPPSLFRRRLSVNKLSLARPSVSSSRPGTKDSSFTDQAPLTAHSRRKSRALSLITPKHGPQASVASIDTAATHYQDPEARHKLRAYLASPQKFDEALEFGFPADNHHATIIPGDAPRRSRSFSRGLFMASSEKLKTFLADDQSSVYSEETSIPDSESPRTPHTPDIQSHSIKPSKISEGYSQGSTASREMTLRMTLTRPDLRSDQGEPYGWPNGLASRKPSGSSHPRPLRVDSPVSVFDDKDATKESMDQIFADIDRELSSSSEGMVRRFWNRVRRG